MYNHDTETGIPSQKQLLILSVVFERLSYCRFRCNTLDLFATLRVTMEQVMSLGLFNIVLAFVLLNFSFISETVVTWAARFLKDALVWALLSPLQ